jgi:hypothetical protein
MKQLGAHRISIAKPCLENVPYTLECTHTYNRALITAFTFDILTHRVAGLGLTLIHIHSHSSALFALRVVAT